MLSRTPGHWSLWLSGYGWSPSSEADIHHSACGWCPQCTASTRDHFPLKTRQNMVKCCILFGYRNYGWKFPHIAYTFTLHSSCYSLQMRYISLLHSPFCMSPSALGVFVSLAVTHSYLRVALYLAGRKVFTESTHEQRTCVWLGTWQEMLSSPGGSGKRESDRFIYRTEMVFVFISRAVTDEYFKSFSVMSSSLKMNSSGVPVRNQNVSGEAWLVPWKTPCP